MFSVTSDIQAGPALKTTAPKPSRQDASQLSDSFSALVDAATPPEPSTSPQPSAAPAPRTGNVAPSRDTARSGDADRTSQTKSSDKPQDKADNGPSRTDKAGSDATSDTTTDKSAKTTTDSTDSTDGKTTDNKKDGDQASADATTAAQAVSADQAPAATPVAVAIPAEITLATPVTGPAATDGDGASAAPTPTGAVGTAAQILNGSVDANAGLMAAAAKTAGAVKTTGEADPTTAGADATTEAATATTATSNQTFAAALDSTTPGGAKPAGKATAQAKGGLATGEVGKSTDQGGAPAQGAHPQTQGTGLTQPPAVAAKPDGTELEPAKGNTVQAPSAHERGAAQANAQTNVPVPDPSAQAAAALQPQLSTPTAQTNPITAANLTATAATTASVPLHGLAVEIAASALNGKSRFEIRLDPAELGRIDVRIDVDRNGQVTSHLRVEKPETLAMLQQTAPQLQQALQDAGLKSNNSGLQFSLRDQNSSGQNGGDPQQNGNSHRLIVAEDENVPVQLAGRSYGRMFGAQGGVDIRV
ncbi:putative flagellar hook length determination protein [Bradyrhizobium sp. ORS 375]|uniref:flagellar hook-length control protein FliK n=1 Tax=Bradyrhizobium sp. (strain ORS 375) TaxID=566679 RepID=UPI0002405846|nr:flagellar hook-length control protein FliK [Bradyrhizobium sp. ORS 375]CCD93551.1 putative flagellar hook length determination protein [Bradyrhizobium sp. ORS 375]